MPGYSIPSASAIPIWNFLAGMDPGATVLFVNADENDTITIDDSQSILPGSTINGAILSPQGSISLPGDKTWYAITDAPDNPILQVTLNGANWTPSAAAIAAQIAESGLALAIAEQIASQGLALIGAPKALYGGIQPRTGAGIVGATLDKWAYTPNTSDDFGQYPVWQSIVGRPFNGVRRCYIQEGDHPTGAPDGNSANSANNGFKIAVSLKPWRDATNVYGNNKIPGQGNYTYAQHLADIKATVVYLQSIAIHGLSICFWHECNGNGQNGPFGSGGPYGAGTTGPQAATNFKTYHNFYEAALNVATNPGLTGNVERVYCSALFSPGNVIDFYPGATHVDAIVTDYYAQDFNSKPSTVPAARQSLMAQAVTDGKKFGYWEVGLTNGATNPSVATVNQWLTSEMIGPMVARLQAGQPNQDFIWFAAPQSGPGPSRNALGSGAAGACNDPTVIANVANLFDQLSSSPTNVLAIGGSASLVVPPLNPSPGAGFAVADGLSYDITLQIATTGTPTQPFLQVQMEWFNNDATGGIPVETQVWRCPIGNSPGTLITGTGPQRGQFLRITINNLDTISCTVAIQVNSTSRNVAKHDWIWDAVSSVNIHAFVLASGGEFGNNLGSVNAVSVPAGGQKKFLFGMRAGYAFVRFAAPAGSSMDYILNPEPQSDMGSAAMLNETIASTDKDFKVTVILPRSPFSITAINNDGVNAHNANIQVECEG